MRASCRYWSIYDDMFSGIFWLETWFLTYLGKYEAAKEAVKADAKNFD